MMSFQSRLMVVVSLGLVEAFSKILKPLAGSVAYI